METYEMVCACGEAMSVEASSEAEAVSRMKDTMTSRAIREHWRLMHRGEFAPSVEDMHWIIETELLPEPAFV